MKVTIDDVLTLIERVSDSNLTKFQFEDEDFGISMTSSKKGRKIKKVGLNRDEIEKKQENKKEQSSSDIKKELKEEKKIAIEEPSSSSALEEEDLGLKMVHSPLVGTFYVAKEEGAEPFVKVGDTVKKGQVIGIVEAMKLMNEVESDYDGIISEILVENEEMVEYNQPLISVIVS